MANYYHGAKARQVDTSLSTPVEADSGVPFVVGTAPVHTVGGTVNEPIMCQSYEEAVTAFGFSDNWKGYTLCEMIYSQFQLYGVYPVVLVNVLDPAKHKKSVKDEEFELEEGKAYLPLEAIQDTVKVKNPDAAEGDPDTYTAGIDYETLYDGENLILEVLEGSAIPETAGMLTISYTAVDPSAVTKKEIIGGFNPTTKQNSGFELLDSVYPKYSIIADLLVAPGYSHDSEVAAIMSAKASNINDVFEGTAICDIDTNVVRYYSDATAWKKSKNINSKHQILCWPLFGLGERIFHASVQAAGRMSLTDSDNGGCPAESPSNKLIQIDRAMLADGTTILLDLKQANYLNSNGIVTALNWIGGYVLWGDETACFPADTDVKNYFICVKRMFAWVANSLILTYWNKVDRKMTRRLIDSIVDSVNLWLNDLTAQEKLLGGRVEFLEEENSTIDLMSGKASFHIFMTPPSPMRECEFVLEYDVDYVSAALTA